MDEHSTDESEESWLKRIARVVPSAALLAPGTRLMGERFTIERRLGRGGMGIVYVAYDGARRERVALKTLPETRPEAVYRIKQEFRALSDVVHPNLVRLHELFEEHGRWFFTMELIDGGLFGERLDVAQLAPAFAALAEGVAAIHASGKLHRDLKPSNVLRAGERVVILDFGLAADAQAGGIGQTVVDGGVSGTPAYMAPEQAAGQVATPASDWYAFGAMLYEALCGRLPFEGSAAALLLAKQVGDPPPPSRHRPGVDPTLETLCLALLARDPSTRSGYDQVRAVFGAASAGPAPASTPSAQAGDTVFVGREAELLELRAAFEATRPGKPSVTLVPGRSGMGKSALLERFCAATTALDGALVLAARCYERENVPYKGVDGVVDALSRYLRQLTPQDAAALMPRDVFLLAQIFPVLARVPSVADAPERALDIEDPIELRRRGFLALGELLGRIRDRRPLIVALDDLQWIDLDSVRLLLGMLSSAEAPGLMLLCAYRGEHASEENTALSDLLRGLVDIGCKPMTVAVGPLGEHELSAIARAAGAKPEDAAAVAHEAQGNPFFAGELMRYHRTEGARSQVRLDEVVAARLALLPSAAQAAMRAAALCAAPLPRSVLLDAAGIGAQDGDPVRELSHARLLRVLDAGGDPRLLPYHDRVREAVAETLGESDRRAMHAELARAWAKREDADPEVLLAHLLGADDRAAAAPHALAAAERAARGLAFDRAANRYELALELLSPQGDARRALLERWADALASAGYCPRASQVYLQSAELTAGEGATALRWRAAEQLLYSQNSSEVVPLLERVLPELGIAMPSRRLRSLRVFLYTLRMVLLPPRVRILAPERRSPATLRAFDVCLAACSALLMGADAHLGLLFYAMAYRLGLESGEPGRVAIALLSRVALRAIVFRPDRAMIETTLARARELLAQCDERTVRAHAQLRLGDVNALSGRWRDAGAEYERAEQLFTGLPGGVGQLTVTARLHRAFTLFQLGIGDLRALLNNELETARARGNRHARVGGHQVLLLGCLHVGDLARARELSRYSDPRPDDSYFEHGDRAIEATRLLAEGDAIAAFELMERSEPAFRKSAARLTASMTVLGVHANAALAVAARGDAGAARARRKAARLKREIARSVHVWLRPWAPVIAAALAFQRGDRDRAARLLLRAEQSFAGFEMAMLAAMVRRQRGLVLGDGAGATLVAEADAALVARGVANPARHTHAAVAGFTGAM